MHGPATTVQWRNVTAFRNRLIHGYDEIEMDRVLEAVPGTVKQALPELKTIRDG
ncbi:MAG: HepT-like ribonuclease domain-containing protein [bacterium]